MEKGLLKFADHKAVRNVIFRNLASPSSKHPRNPDKHCLENYINSSENVPCACREYIIANDVHEFIESNLVQLQQTDAEPGDLISQNYLRVPQEEIKTMRDNLNVAIEQNISDEYESKFDAKEYNPADVWNVIRPVLQKITKEEIAEQKRLLKEQKEREKQLAQQKKEQQ